MSEESEPTVKCDKCETDYSIDQDTCPDCGSKMTRPEFVIDSDYVRDAPPMNVQVSEGFEEADPRRLQITMMKPGDAGEEPKWPSISFTTPEIFQKTLTSIDELYETTRWTDRSSLLDDLNQDHTDQEKVHELLIQYPSFFNEVLDTVDFERMGEDDVGYLTEAIRNLNDSVLQAEEQIQESFLELLEQLSDEDERAYDELSDLFQEWHALQVTSTSNVLMRRIQFLETFEDMIHDSNVYEIRGDQSIHRSLENNLWLLNEDYWLMQSDKSLRRFVQDELGKELSEGDSEEGNRRPDFVCATHGNRLVIAEIKRPSHTLTTDDVSQLSDYMYYAQKYSGSDYEPVDGFLIGNTFDDRAQHRANSNNNIDILTYQDILSDARLRYREYLQALEESDAPVPMSSFDPNEI